VPALTMARIIMRNFLSGPATRRYPHVVRPPFAATRGRIEIDYPACIHCGACDRRCPAGAITVGKEPKSWRIDRFACVTCNLCVRVCPKKCLSMSAERTRAVDFADLAGRVESHVTAAAASVSEGAAGAPGA
jgi:ech hydrogenase subunit F